TKPIGTLLSKDSFGEPLRAQLAVSRSYIPLVDAGSIAALDSPCVYNKPVLNDTTIVWQVVADNTWNLLPDRIGIRIICPDVEAWPVGKPPAGDAIPPNGTPQFWGVADGKLRGITSLCDPLLGGPPGNPVGGAYTTELYSLRLTCVFEGDQDQAIVASRRDASPLATTVRRRVDTRDHFGLD